MKIRKGHLRHEQGKGLAVTGCLRIHHCRPGLLGMEHRVTNMKVTHSTLTHCAGWGGGVEVSLGGDGPFVTPALLTALQVCSHPQPMVVMMT